jgi:hypothetical protein
MLPLGVAAQVEGPEFAPPQHYLCYETKTKPQAPKLPIVMFVPQIGNEYQEAVMGDAARFCNPAAKWYGESWSPIYDEDFHYAWYRVARQPGRPLNQRITVTNQFGEQPLKLQRLMFVALPAWKLAVNGEPTGHEPVGGLSYACYSVLGRNPRVSVLVSDQFQETAKRVQEPAFYCSPAVVFPGDFQNAEHEEFEPAYGYVCYNTRHSGPRESGWTVTVPLPFFFGEVSSADRETPTEDLTLTKSGLLCVPNEYQPFPID